MYEYYYKCASRERKEKCNKYRFHEDSVRCIMGEVLLKQALLRIGTDITKYRIERGKYGKPYLHPLVKDGKKLYFNISHSGKWVFLILADIEVGIDVEEIQEKGVAVAEHFFTGQECRCILKSDCPENTFTRLWTIKEAYIKFLGMGLYKELDSFTVSVNEENITITDQGERQDISIYSYGLDGYYVTYILGKKYH